MTGGEHGSDVIRQRQKCAHRNVHMRDRNRSFCAERKIGR